MRVPDPPYDVWVNNRNAHWFESVQDAIDFAAAQLTIGASVRYGNDLRLALTIQPEHQEETPTPDSKAKALDDTWRQWEQAKTNGDTEGAKRLKERYYRLLNNASSADIIESIREE